MIAMVRVIDGPFQEKSYFVMVKEPIVSLREPNGEKETAACSLEGYTCKK